VACYGLSPTFKGSSKGSFAFWTTGHHLSRNTTPVHSLHTLFSVIRIQLCGDILLINTLNPMITSRPAENGRHAERGKGVSHYRACSVLKHVGFSIWARGGGCSSLELIKGTVYISSRN
jgi:hypothetical protein